MLIIKKSFPEWEAVQDGGCFTSWGCWGCWGQEQDQAAATTFSRSPGKSKGHSFLLTSLPCPRNTLWIWSQCAHIFCWSLFSITAMASTLQENEKLLISAAPKVSRNRPGKQYNDKSVDLSGMTRAEVPTHSREHQRTKLLPFNVVFLLYSYFFSPTGTRLKNRGMQCN